MSLAKMKKKGERPVTFNDIRDFNEMIAKTGLTDGGFEGKSLFGLITK